jgi:hypothetical protein
MSRSDKPIKIVLSASICLVASSALQGTTTTVQAKPEEQWRAVQQSIERAAKIEQEKAARGSLRIAEVDPPMQPYSPGPGGAPTPIRPARSVLSRQMTVRPPTVRPPTVRPPR